MNRRFLCGAESRLGNWPEPPFPQRVVLPGVQQQPGSPMGHELRNAPGVAAGADGETSAPETRRFSRIVPDQKVILPETCNCRGPQIRLLVDVADRKGVDV